MGTTAFNLAEELQTLVLVLSDLDLGMNYWMTNHLRCQTSRSSAGKYFRPNKLKNSDLPATKMLTAMAFRTTLPGTDHPRAACFAAWHRPQ